MSTVEKNFKFLKIMSELNKLDKKPFVKVGLIGNKQHKGKNSTVVEVGMAHEFGAPSKNIPERSFMRSTFDERKEKWFRKTRRLHSLILGGRGEVFSGLKKIGLSIEKDIKDKFIKQDPSWAQLSDKTIKRKKSSKILIDTAQTMNSIKTVLVK